MPRPITFSLTMTSIWHVDTLIDLADLMEPLDENENFRDTFPESLAYILECATNLVNYDHFLPEQVEGIRRWCRMLGERLNDASLLPNKPVWMPKTKEKQELWDAAPPNPGRRIPLQYIYIARQKECYDRAYIDGETFQEIASAPLRSVPKYWKDGGYHDYQYTPGGARGAAQRFASKLRTERIRYSLRNPEQKRFTEKEWIDYYHEHRDIPPETHPTSSPHTPSEAAS